MRRPLASLGLVVLFGLTLAGCSNSAPAVGVTEHDDLVVVRYKPCEPSDRIEKLDLYGGTDATHPVWSARREAGASGRTEIAVAPRVPGYRVTDHLGATGIVPSELYSFDAHSTRGAAWGGPDVQADRLVPGRVRVAGQSLDYATWSRQPVDCPRVTVARAGTAGLVVAIAAAAMILLARGALRAISRRRPAEGGSAT